MAPMLGFNALQVEARLGLAAKVHQDISNGVGCAPLLADNPANVIRGHLDLRDI